MDEQTQDLDWLLTRAKELRIDNARRAAVFVLNLVNGRPGYVAAQKAGYSPGLTSDEATARRNLAAQATRAKRSKKISRLLTEFLEYRHGEADDVMTSAEVLAALSQEAKNGTGSTKVAALRLLSDFHHKNAVPLSQIPPVRFIENGCARDNPLIQALSVTTGKLWKRRGMQSMQNWEVPAELRELEKLIDRFGVTAEALFSLTEPLSAEE